MSFTSDQIGQRLKAFRKYKGLTQQQLELELGLSPGHVSKIESGKINPTKETLLKISEVMQLIQNEKQILLGLNLDPVTSNQINHAIKLVSAEFASSPNLMIMTDDFGFIWKANKKIYQLLGLPEHNDICEQYKKNNAGINFLS